MTSILLLLCCVCQPASPALARHGFQDAQFLTLQRVGVNLLVVGTRDNRVALFDPDGQAITVLPPSDDPADAAPLLLGATEREILLVRGGSRVVAYDHRLVRRDDTYDALPVPMVGGFYLGSGFFLANSYGNAPYAVTLMSQEGTGWAVQQHLLPLTYGPAAGDLPAVPTTWVGVHGKFAFQWAPLPAGARTYSAEVYDLAEGAEKPLLVLTGEAGHASVPPDSVAYLESAFRVRGGYVLTLVQADPGDGKVRARSAEHFDREGVFLRRKSLGPDTLLKAVVGTHDLMRLDARTMTLSPAGY